MNQIFHFALYFHILNGTVALVIAPLAMITVKGGLWHRRWGKIYFWAMAGVALTAVVMCFIRSGMFLFLVAIFSFYMALTGYTVLRRKKPKTAGDSGLARRHGHVHRGYTFVTTATLDTSSGNQRWVRMVFGSIGLILSGMDIWRFFKPPQGKRAWWYQHMGRFLAAYIATVTAFSVVNFDVCPISGAGFGRRRLASL